ncbi:hypothetical protein BG003_000849, partial [Podila horticola]
SDPSGKTIKNQRLPGLEALTPEQLFFVSYARMWCSKMRPEALLQQVLTNPHSPAEWRIKGALQNSEYFARAFKCKSGAPMNPVKKCERGFQHGDQLDRRQWGMALCEALKTNSTLPTLNLQCNSIKENGGLALAETLKAN